MPRRPDPARIAIAQREGVRMRLTGAGLTYELAGEWLDAWQREGQPGGWDAAFEWVQEQRRTGRRRP